MLIEIIHMWLQRNNLGIKTTIRLGFLITKLANRENENLGMYVRRGNKDCLGAILISDLGPHILYR